MTELSKRFDVIVVGSGASGSIAVKELTERGLEVLLLEAGRDITEGDFTPQPEAPPSATGIALWPRFKASVRGQPLQARRVFFRPQISPFLVNDKDNPYTSEADFFLWIRGRQLGGRLHAYGRVLLRKSQGEFKAASIDGYGEDWPISYSDVAPYYSRIEEFIGLYGTPEHLPNLPDGVYQGPSKLTSAEANFKAKVEGRWPERHVIPWRYAAPNLFRVPLGIRAARQTGRLTTRTDSIVRRIAVDPKTGRADGAFFIDRRTKKEHRVYANIVVLCASTIESIRLLLNSACVSHPNGLANSSGVLGRYFMDQTPGIVFGQDPTHAGSESDDSAPPDPFYSSAGGCYIPRFHNAGVTARDDFVRGYALQGTVGRIPVPDGEPAAVGLMTFGEMLPRALNQITLDPRRRDGWGVPIPRIRVSLSGNERALLDAQVREVREMSEYCGYRVSFAGSTLGLDSRKVLPNADPLSRLIFKAGFKKSLAIGGAVHECGGARMGSDPGTSVLNEHNQSWDVPNLFVTDASCYVSSGVVGPTLTIMALTARACEFIACEYATGSI